MLKKALFSAAACAFLLTACGKHAPQVDPVVYQKDVDDWKAGRLARLTGPDGWTTLVGLYWLKAGDNKFGSAADNDMPLSAAGLPAHVGHFSFDGKTVSFTAAKDAKVMSGGKPVTTIKMVSDADAPPNTDPTTLSVGSVSFYAIKRVDKMG